MAPFPFPFLNFFLLDLFHTTGSRCGKTPEVAPGGPRRLRIFDLSPSFDRIIRLSSAGRARRRIQMSPVRVQPTAAGLVGVGERKTVFGV